MTLTKILLEVRWVTHEQTHVCKHRMKLCYYELNTDREKIKLTDEHKGQILLYFLCPSDLQARCLTELQSQN